MDERDDFDMDDIFSGIHELVNKRGVVPEYDVEKPRREDHDEQATNFSRLFVTNMFPIIYRSADPREIAPMIKREFAGFKANIATRFRTEDAGLAEIIDGLSLDDAAKSAVGLIKDSERELAKFFPGSGNYKIIEREIRRLEIIERACLEARDLP